MSYACVIVAILSAWFFYQWMSNKYKLEKCKYNGGSSVSSSDDYGSSPMYGGSSAGGARQPEKHSSWEFWTWFWTLIIFFVILWLCKQKGGGYEMPSMG